MTNKIPVFVDKNSLFQNTPYRDKGHREPTRSTPEVVEIFGYKDARALLKDIETGNFPPPDVLMATLQHKIANRKHWHISTIIAEKKKRNIK